MRVMHLIKSGGGTMAVKSACGRNILRLPLALNWDGFKAETHFKLCEKCEASTQAALNRRKDAKIEAAKTWEPAEYSHADDVARFPKLLEKQAGTLGSRKII